MPLFDLKCPSCEYVDIDILLSNADVSRLCPHCNNGYMTRLPAVSAFTIEGYSAKNGYAQEGK